jgi:hypothetical protein
VKIGLFSGQRTVIAQQKTAQAAGIVWAFLSWIESAKSIVEISYFLAMLNSTVDICSMRTFVL